jgi:hypothetical protein
MVSNISAVRSNIGNVLLSRKLLKGFVVCFPFLEVMGEGGFLLGTLGNRGRNVEQRSICSQDRSSRRQHEDQ